MKRKIIGIILIIILCMQVLIPTVLGAQNVVTDEITTKTTDNDEEIQFEDTNLKNLLIKNANVDKDSNGIITLGELETLTELTINTQINSLKGLENAKNLTTLKFDTDEAYIFSDNFFTSMTSVKNIEIKLPINRMTYDEAINLYGSDKPDLRFENPIYDITDYFKESDFSLFKNIINDGGIINALVFNAADKYSRKDIDKLTDYVKTYGAKALAFLKYNGEFTGSIAKFVNEEIGKNLIRSLDLKDNDLVLIIAGDKKMVKTSLGALRCKVAKDLDLISKDKYALTWVTDFPMFEYSEEEERYIACHHPFTLPQDIDGLDDKENAKAYAYDIVINGYEAGGGSLRIYNPLDQEKVLEALGFSKEQALSQFGFLLDALKYGCPPHGGLALGLERLTMILCGTENIRDVIAFPKTTSASCLMTEAPSEVALKQLDELHIKISE